MDRTHRQAQFRFFAELNDFLPPKLRGQMIACPINGDQSVKHLIESLGIPHPEVHRILVNDAPVDFGYIVQDGDHIDVFPISTPDLRSQLKGERRFIIDNHLGRLAVYLRMLGFDTLYRNDYHDDELAQDASRERRILLTRDVRLLMRNLVTDGYWVRSKIPRQQLVEIVRRYELAPLIVPFRRCMRCNDPLQPVTKEQVLHRLEPLTKQYYDDFHLCSSCDQVYWKGSHYERMQKFLVQVISEANDPSKDPVNSLNRT